MSADRFTPQARKHVRLVLGLFVQAADHAGRDMTDAPGVLEDFRAGRFICDAALLEIAGWLELTREDLTRAAAVAAARDGRLFARARSSGRAAA
ncbi:MULTISPECIES: hypothetical protein [Alphaproteobacteria]|uniref:hypothetical protein n=1 Tax=Alphaproteobacteria TaxID=28211 RepID=UPI003A94B9D6